MLFVVVVGVDGVGGVLVLVLCSDCGEWLVLHDGAVNIGGVPVVVARVCLCLSPPPFFYFIGCSCC